MNAGELSDLELALLACYRLAARRGRELRQAAERSGKHNTSQPLEEQDQAVADKQSEANSNLGPQPQ